MKNKRRCSLEQLNSLEWKDVFILGAGFSKAASENVTNNEETFPVATELLDPILERLDDRLSNAVKPYGGEGFEQWISRLAEDQPHLSADENLERSLAFLRVSHKIGEILTERENSVLERAMPAWLAELLFAWHVRHATVISFNYDNLIECGVMSQHLPMLDRYSVRTHDILNRLPPLPPSRQSEETRVSNIQGGGRRSLAEDYFEQRASWMDTFRLIKLHGSISWYWVPDDATGATMQRWPDVGSFGHPVGDQRAEIRRQLPGRELFIAPPSSTKSRYLANPVVRQLWRDAFDALREADRIFFLGYSIPPQDQAAMSLIIEGIGGRKPQIHIVDIHADAVRDNLAKLLVKYEPPQGEQEVDILRKKASEFESSYQLQLHSGTYSVTDFAVSYLAELATECASKLTGYARSLPVLDQTIEADPADQAPKSEPVVGGIFVMVGQDYKIMDFDNITVENETLTIPCRLGVYVVENQEPTKLWQNLKKENVRKIVLQLPEQNDTNVQPVVPIVGYRLKTNKQLASHNPPQCALQLIPFIPQPPSDPPTTGKS